MRRRRFLAGAAAALLPTLKAQADTGAVALAGDRFRIGDQDYQLTDILAPSAYTLNGRAEPHFEASRNVLQIFLSQRAFIFEDAAQRTRWGARVVRSQTEGGGQSLEELLIAAGAARVAPKTDDIGFISGLLATEGAARQQQTGLWSLNAYRIFDASNAQGAIGGYHLVEGQVVSANKTRSRFYLNFGADYRDDFTASAASAVIRRWAKKEFDPATLEGARVRVRGFVESINGPSVDMAHRLQIEVISANENAALKSQGGASSL